jgi:hypothetical protein
VNDLAFNRVSASMLHNSQDTGLVILAYQPQHNVSTRSEALIRSNALSHAARVTHARRRQRMRQEFKSTQDDAKKIKDEVGQQQLSPRQRRFFADRVSPLDLGPLQQGNRDPFLAASVPVTPQTVDLMAHWKAYVQVNPNDDIRPLSDADRLVCRVGETCDGSAEVAGATEGGHLHVPLP